MHIPDPDVKKRFEIYSLFSHIFCQTFSVDMFRVSFVPIVFFAINFRRFMMNNPLTSDATKRSREYQNQPVNSSSAIAMWWEKYGDDVEENA